MRDIVQQQIAHAGLQPGDKLLIAVSGGVDSVVLLQLLASCAPQLGLSLSVAHLDHRLRPESSVDAEFVRQLSAKLALPCICESCDVAALAEAERISLEMAGRQARRELLQRTADKVDARLIALAHHRDDQVETFLLRLLRGSGTSGLAAMRSLDGRWWRPLLDCPQEQIVDYARREGFSWVEDASNREPVFLRNRIRHTLLEQLREINPRFDERVQELCRQLRVDENYWRQQAADGLRQVLLCCDDGLRLDGQQLAALPEALQVRILREAVRSVRGDLQRLEAVHLRAIIDLLEGGRSQGQLDLPGCWVAKRYTELWLRPDPPDLAGFALEVPVPGALELPDGQELRCELVARPAGETASCVEFDRALLDLPLTVRSWRKGDRFSPSGMVGSKKLKRLFGDEKITQEERLKIPLLVSGEKILWVVGLRRSVIAPVTEKSTEILQVTLVGKG